MSTLDRIRERIISEFQPMWALNDPAHRVEHFTRVEDCGNLINTRLGLGYDPTLITYVAFFHDLFAWSRKNHHRLSAEFVRGTCHPVFEHITDAQRGLVASACEEHRASFKGAFTNAFCELMNSADREAPGAVNSMVARAVDYQRARGECSEQAVLAVSVQHVKDKFGTGGYARYPDLYVRCFGDELANQRRTVDLMRLEHFHEQVI